MLKGNYLTTILQSSKTVFTFKDIVILWQESNINAATVRLNYYVRNHDLFKIRKGIYAKNKDYDKLELATRMFTPAYVSFETVLAREGLIFQYQTKIQVASYTTREIEIDSQIYSFNKVKSSILTNSLGVENINGSSIATKERALLDILYTNTDYHFDNLRSIDWKNVFEILPIYNNNRMVKIIEKLKI
ncbi:MAG: hypothetical protein NT162_02715 [Candidatus Woesebacteria bacterium]|nr:hypothetical protein [Candidatus Woesebacteria bacterium]